MNSSERTETGKAFIWIDDEGILHLKLNEGAEIDLKEVEKHFSIYKDLRLQKHKALQLFEGGAFFAFNSDAMKYVANNGSDFFIASAIVNNSLAIRILFGFFKKFFDQSFPFEMFGTKGEALKWLRTQKKVSK